MLLQELKKRRYEQKTEKLWRNQKTPESKGVWQGERKDEIGASVLNRHSKKNEKCEQKTNSLTRIRENGGGKGGETREKKEK